MFKVTRTRVRRPKKEQDAIYRQSQKSKGLKRISVYLSERSVTQFKRIKKRLFHRGGSERIWTNTSLVSRSISDLYFNIFTSTTLPPEECARYESACNIKRGFLPVFKTPVALHIGSRLQFPLRTRAEALEKAKTKTGELRADFLGVIEIPFIEGGVSLPEIVDSAGRGEKYPKND